MVSTENDEKVKLFPNLRGVLKENKTIGPRAYCKFLPSTTKTVKKLIHLRNGICARAYPELSDYKGRV